MVIQCGCLDMMRAEDGKLHSQLEWPYNFTISENSSRLYNLVKVGPLDVATPVTYVDLATVARSVDYK